MVYLIVLGFLGLITATAIIASKHFKKKVYEPDEHETAHEKTYI